MTDVKFNDADFVKSSFSNYKWVHACVLVAIKNDVIGLRDSKDLNKITLQFTVSEWQAFIEGVKAGEFDRPSLSASG